MTTAIPLDSLLATAACRHGTFSYFQADMYVGRSLALYGEFSEAEVELFRQLLRPGAVVVEAGANIGALTVPIAQFVGAHGRVVAYEPQRALATVLVRNVLANGLTNVEVRRAGLGAAPGTATLPRIDYRIAGNFGGVSLAVQDGDRNGDDVTVETIDGLALDRLDFVKIDVEGMETDVLIGASATLKRCRPLVYVENDRRERSKQLLSTLFALGYQPWWFVTRLFNGRNYRGCIENVFGEIESTNLICAPVEADLEFVGTERVGDADDTRERVRHRVRERLAKRKG